MSATRAGFIIALLVLAPTPLAQSAGQPDLVPGDAALDGDFRVRSFAWPARVFEPDRTVTRAFTPRYPASERLSRRDYRSRVLVRLDSTGAVVLAHVMGVGREPSSYVAFDSASARAARLWTWEPGSLTDRQTLEFVFRGRPVAPQGEGSAVIFAFESVSGDTLQGLGEVIDTARGIVTKDMVIDKDVRLLLTSTELDRIRRKMMEFRLFDMSDLPPSSAITIPDEEFVLEVTAGGRMKRVSWNWSDGDGFYPSDDWKRRRDLVRFIREIVTARSEWKALPPSRGASL